MEERAIRVHSGDDGDVEALRAELADLRERVDRLRIWQAYVLGAASAVGALVSMAIMLASKVIK